MLGKKKVMSKSSIFMCLLVLLMLHQVDGKLGLVKRRGSRFVAGGKPVFLNGLNAYWLAYTAADPGTVGSVTSTFDEASKVGINIARTWAFRDGGYRPLQSSPGSYNEVMFKALDFVISEANKHGIYLIMSLVNNYGDYGGRQQYVEWAKERGQILTNQDDFFTNPLTKTFYKNHVKTVLSRVNTITGVAYKDDPTIFAWELMNEPRCETDVSGKTLQKWIVEMAGHVKSIDGKHMVTVGVEGFYGKTIPERSQVYNPGGHLFGTDFIANHQLHQIDFATIHVYAELWLPNSSDEEQAKFTSEFLKSHVQDSKQLLKKPLMICEFGKSSRLGGYSLEKRNAYFQNVYDEIYKSASGGGPFVGGLYWQGMPSGLEGFKDGYEVILEETPSTKTIVTEQSKRLSKIK